MPTPPPAAPRRPSPAATRGPADGPRRWLGCLLILGLIGMGEPPVARAGEPTATHMSIEVEDARLSGVLRMISNVSGQGFVLDAAHDREVTIRLIDVPWDVALHAILAVEGLMAVPVSPGVMRVAPRVP